MAKIKVLPEQLTTRMTPPPEITQPVLELGHGAWDAWNCGEAVSGDTADMCNAYLTWCTDEQERRFDRLLEYMDCGKLVGDDSETAHKWRTLALSLAAMHFRGLKLPEPHLKKSPGRKNVDRQILDAVGDEIVKAQEAGRHISENRAFELAKKNNPWM
jgi:hypothetical protein